MRQAYALCCLRLNLPRVPRGLDTATATPPATPPLSSLTPTHNPRIILAIHGGVSPCPTTNRRNRIMPGGGFVVIGVKQFIVSRISVW